MLSALRNLSLRGGLRQGADAVHRRWYGAAENFVYHTEDPSPELPDWAGADREALVYRSIEDFTPAGVISLNGVLFNAPVRQDLIHSAVVWQRARWRAGTANTKTRGEVKGSTRKPWPQKGLGKARHGDRKAPQWKGGGVVMGPKPRDWSIGLNRNQWRFALRSTLTMKYSNGNIWIISTPELETHKTRAFERAIKRLRWESALIYDYAPDGHWGTTFNLNRATAATRNYQVQNVDGLNVYDMLLFKHVVFTQKAIAKLDERFEEYRRKRLFY